MPTYDYHCLRCNGAFEIMFLPYPPPPTVVDKCPTCAQELDTITGGPASSVAERVWLSGSWTEPGTGIFKPHYDPGLGVHVSSKRHQMETAKKAGLVPYGTTKRPTKKLELSHAEIEYARDRLKPEQVARMRERREQLDHADRNGLPAPPPKA